MVREQGKPKKPAEQKPFEPWRPPALDIAEIAALKAVANGTASADQQMRCMRTVIEKVACTYDETYCPGENGNRDSAYAAGKRRVGLALVTYINAPMDLFRDDDRPREQG